jgi:hypothetical protein
VSANNKLALTSPSDNNSEGELKQMTKTQELRRLTLAESKLAKLVAQYGNNSEKVDAQRRIRDEALVAAGDGVSYNVLGEIFGISAGGARRRYRNALGALGIKSDVVSALTPKRARS